MLFLHMIGKNRVTRNQEQRILTNDEAKVTDLSNHVVGFSVEVCMTCITEAGTEYQLHPLTNKMY